MSVHGLMRSRRANVGAILVLVLLPTILLGNCLFGGRTFVPRDLAIHSPIATTLSAAEREQIARDTYHGADDVVMIFVPELRFGRKELDVGRVPHWNPNARFGAPLASTTVTGFFYPFNLPMLARADPQDGLGWTAWISFVIAGGLMFGFARTLGLGRTAALFGAIAFSLSGTLVSNAYFYQRLAALVWLPGILWGVHAVVTSANAPIHRGRLVRAVTLLAACLALNALAGFPYFAAMHVLVGGIYGAVLLVSDSTRRTPRVAGVFGLGIAGALALGLAAFALWPMVTFFSDYVHRAPETANSLASHSLSPASYLAWLAPSLFGHPFEPSLDSARSVLNYWLLSRDSWNGDAVFDPTWSFVENTIFVGTLTLPLALFAALRPKRVFERAMVIAAGLLVVLSLGTGWLSWLHNAPGMSSIMPMRFATPLAGVVSLLAASGLDRLTSERASLRGRWIGRICIGLGVAALVLWFWIRSGTGGELVDRLLPDVYERFSPYRPDLTYDDAVAHVSGPPRDLNDEIGIVAHAAHQALSRAALRVFVMFLLVGVWWRQFTRRAAGTPRALSGWHAIAIVGITAELTVLAAPLLHGVEMHAERETDVHRYLLEQRSSSLDVGGFAAARATSAVGGKKVLPLAFPPCSLGELGIRDVHAYTFLDSYSHLGFAAVWGEDHLIHGDAWPFALPDDDRLSHPLLDLLGVRWLLSEDRLRHAGDPAVVLEGSPDRGSTEPRRCYVYERANPMPRAFTVPGLTVVENEAEVLSALASRDMDPAATAWITSDEPVPADPLSRPAGPTQRRTVRFVSDDTLEVVIHVDAGEPAWLILNDSWSAGWSAQLGDDTPAEIYRANLSMRAVHIPAEETTVTFRYQPPRWAGGIAISITALGFVLVALLTCFRRVLPGD